MTTNRSSAELAMRDAVERWGRARWPDARVVHELVTSECRIDMAFVRPSDLIGVEIKSDRDVLDRLDKQLATFREHMPEVWVMVGPKWKDKAREWYSGVAVIEDGDVAMHWPAIDPAKPWSAFPVQPPGRRWDIYPRMLRLLWAQEARNIAARKQISHTRRSTLGRLLPELAALLTGREIITEVCTELRARDAFWKADPPIAPMRRAA
jgi:hypothetical protein